MSEVSQCSPRLKIIPKSDKEPVADRLGGGQNTRPNAENENGHNSAVFGPTAPNICTPTKVYKKLKTSVL